ncbi:MAG: ribonuclease III [Patescibacteria group bacterium]|nr:ribonuclease III [Patescibacteria group bacterium]MDD5295112.1 ribonuclease III [Patescibacteria group bacterium]MDD5554230.1 ribonuclease III [Patescibacteria group bacterium]
MKNFSKLEDILGFKFKDENLLKQAVVHRSYLNEHPAFGLNHNERLEFLGDAVLEIVVTEYLFYHFPETPEGDLTNWRASLVNAKMLSEIANEIGLEDYLYLSKGESKDKNSKARQYILANAVEALIGAVYLDHGLKTVKKFIKENIISKLDNILENKLYLDPKSKFQEKAQEIHGVTPYYKVLSETGPDHSKIFEVGLYLNEELVAKGKGSSKQEAQVKAAAAGLKKKDW